MGLYMRDGWLRVGGGGVDRGFFLFFFVFGGDADSEELETAMLPLGWLVGFVRRARGVSFCDGFCLLFFFHLSFGGREREDTMHY